MNFFTAPRYTVISFLLTAILFLLSFTNSYAQPSNSISSVEIGEAVEGQPLDITVNLLPVANVANIRIAYRIYEESEFSIREMELAGNTAEFTIPGQDVKLPYLSYYLIITFTNGQLETYPLGIDEGENQPLEITVGAASPKSQEILILSPTEGEKVAVEKLFISVSLIKASDNIDVSKTKLFLNDEDITEYCLFAGDIILFYADNFPETVGLGSQNLRVETYDKEGNLYHTIRSQFISVTERSLQLAQQDFDYNGSLQAESRNEQYSDEATWYNNLQLKLNGKYDDFRFKGLAYLTSEEDETVQPQHRFSARVNYQDWFELRAGDVYPQYPELILDGKRVRGVSGRLNFGVFNLQTSYGQIYREVEGELLQTYSSEDAPLTTNIIRIDSAKYGQPFGEIRPGTFNRDIFVVRPSFGSGRTFQWGLTYMHSKDDPNSIELGARPEENLVAGTDLKFALDDQNIIFRSQAAVSVFNSDISGGEITDEQIDSLFASGDNTALGDDKDQVKDLKNLISKFITFNQYIGPVNPEELSSLAAQAELSLNYFNNNFRARYIYRGGQYESFGQDFLRTDVKGINISDRIRLVSNQLFISLGYERLEDNLQDNKVATTKYQTLNSSISYFPRHDFPSITVGYTRYQNDNGISIEDTVNNVYLIDDVTNRILTRFAYKFDFGVDHATSLSFTTSTREDNSIYQTDANYISTSFNVNSYWTNDLSSFFNFIYYDSEISGEPYQYTTVTLGGKYKMLDDRLELSLSVSPSFGDFERQAIDFLGQYLVIQNLRLILQLRYYNIPDISSNSIAGLTARWNF